MKPGEPLSLRDSYGAKIAGAYFTNPNEFIIQILWKLIFLYFWLPDQITLFHMVTANQLSWHMKKHDSNWTFLRKKQQDIYLTRCGLWASKLIVNCLCEHKALSADIQNRLKIIFAVIMVIQPGHKFASHDSSTAMTFAKKWADCIIIFQPRATWMLDHELINLLWNGSLIMG